MLSEIISALIGGGFTLVGIYVGNHLSLKSIKSQEETHFLVEFYAEVFSTYTATAPNRPLDRVYTFLAAVEKAKLFCSPESEEILLKLSHEITSETVSWDVCGSLMDSLRKSAKKDLRQRQRK